MVFIIRKLVLPVVIAAFAGLVSVMLRNAYELNLFQTWLSAAAIFCVLMALALYGLFVWRSETTKRQLAGFLGFEEDILRRLQRLDIDNKQRGTKTEISERVEKLELELDGISEILAGENVLPGQHAKGHVGTDDQQGADLEAPLSDDGKVVRLKRSVELPVAQQRKQPGIGRTTATNILENAPFSIRLQPIIDLMEKRPIALEAFGYFDTPSGMREASDILPNLNQLQRSQFDLKTVHALGQIAREMSKNDQALPIHYELSSIRSSRDADWERLIEAVRADRKLASVFVPVISAENFERLTSKAMEKFIELLELGLKPCISGITANSEILNQLDNTQFGQFKIDASELFRYRKGGRERVADEILPILLKAGHIPFVSGVEKPFQAGQLIEMNVLGCQGEAISPPRKLTLFHEAKEPPLDQKGSGPDDKSA